MTADSNISQGLPLAGPLNEEEMIEAMNKIMAGEASESTLEEFLTVLTERGETVPEITGAARVLRSKAATIQAPPNAIDCCGTGGDGVGTYNISTAVAIVSAACGVPIAKHGNRASSSKSGAADVLEALGINLDVPHEKLEAALKDLNFCFLMAPHHHSAMKHVVPVRRKLGFRTIFNILGPLANPAGTKRQLIGVFDKKWLIPMAQTLDKLGTEKAWVVHGSDGLDEITTTGSTHVVMLDSGKISETEITPEEFGLNISAAEELLGGNAQENAEALLALLKGSKTAYRDIVLANSSAVLNIAGITNDLKSGIERAKKAIDSEEAFKLVESYKAYVQG